MCTIVHTYVELTSYDANSIACTRCGQIFFKVECFIFVIFFCFDKICIFETFKKQFHEIFEIIFLWKQGGRMKSKDAP